MGKFLLTFSSSKTLRKSILGLFCSEKRSLYWTSTTSFIWKRPIKLFLLIALLSGCSLYQITSDETTSDDHPAKFSSSEVLYLKKLPQSYPYKVVGYVKVNTERNQKEEEVIEKLKHEAAAMGGDAIINITPTDGEGGAKNKFTQFLENARLRQSYRADVVVFGDSPSKIQTQQNH